jgi:hypothetical protein
MMSNTEIAREASAILGGEVSGWRRPGQRRDTSSVWPRRGPALPLLTELTITHTSR